MNLNEREIAIYIFDSIIQQEAYNNIALRRGLNDNKDLTQVQRKYVTEIVNGTLRNVILIDYIINEFSKTKTDKMKSLILSTLRTSTYQIMYMDKTPDSAVCNTAVEFVKSKGFGGLSGFVNGVLRNISRNKDNIKYPQESMKDKALYLSIMYSYPKWLIGYWLKSYDYKVVKAMCEFNNTNPKMNICVNTTKITKDELVKKLEKNDVLVTEGELAKNALIISNTSNIQNTKEFDDGLYHTMDESSQLAIDIMNPKENSVVLDVCSAPGGKSFYSSIKMNNTGKVVACDIHEHKIELINETKERLGLNIETRLADATKYNSEFEQIADYVLVDAPCSGLGLVRKKPDIKLKKEYDDIIQLVEIQKEIMKNAQNYVKIDGILMYTTCTVSVKENDDVIKWFVDNYNYELVPFEFEGNMTDGTLQLIPNGENIKTDGFYIAKLIRKG